MTVEKCDCNFSVKSQSNEFQNKIQWAFLKFSYIHEFETLFKIQKLDSRSIYAGTSVGLWLVACRLSGIHDTSHDDSVFPRLYRCIIV